VAAAVEVIMVNVLIVGVKGLIVRVEITTQDVIRAVKCAVMFVAGFFLSRVLKGA